MAVRGKGCGVMSLGPYWRARLVGSPGGGTLKGVYGLAVEGAVRQTVSLLGNMGDRNP
jgi:hypothetical protein